MRSLFKLSAPLLMAASFPAIAQDDAATTAPADAQISWTSVSLINDTSAPDEKVKRAEKSRETDSYWITLKTLADEQRKLNILSQNTQNIKSYIIFLEGFTNPDITGDILYAQYDLTPNDPEKKTLDKNYDLVLQCRQENADVTFSSRYVHFQQVAGCALAKLNAPVVKPKTILDIREYALAAPYPLAEKLYAYSDDDFFKSSIGKDYNFFKTQGYFGYMSGKTALRLADAMLDINVEFEDLANIKDFQDDSYVAELNRRTPGKEFVLDDNMDITLECRDEILPANVPTDIKDRHNLLINIAECAIPRIRAADVALKAEFDARAPYAAVDPAPLDKKISALQGDQTIFRDYQSHMKTAIYKKNLDRKYLDIESSVAAVHAMLDKSMTWTELDAYPGLYLDSDEEKFLTHNLQHMLSCRDELVPDNLSKTDMPARMAAFNAVHDCWVNKNKPLVEQINKEEAEARAQKRAAEKARADERAAEARARDIKEKKETKILLWLWAGFVGLLLAGKGIQISVQTVKKRNRNKKRALNS